MLTGSNVARSQVEEIVLLRKAKSWQYEQEWRLIGDYGLRNSRLELEEIVFGMKCKSSIKYVVMKILEKRDRKIKFYELCEERGTFNLQKTALNYDDELFSHFPIRYRTLLEVFQPISSTSHKNED